MAVDNISNFLKKHLKITPPNDSIRRSVVRAIKNEVGIEIGKEKVRFIRNTVYLDITPAARSRVFVSKDRIMKALEDDLGAGKITDIR